MPVILRGNSGDFFRLKAEATGAEATGAEATGAEATGGSHEKTLDCVEVKQR